MKEGTFQNNLQVPKAWEMEARVRHFPGVQCAGRVSSWGGGTGASSPSSPWSRPSRGIGRPLTVARCPGWHRGPRTWGVPEASRTVVRSALSCGRGGLGGTPARPVDYLRPRGSPNLETAEPGSTKFWSDWDDGLSITGGGDLVPWDPGGGARGLPAIESASKKKKGLASSGRTELSVPGTYMVGTS